MSEPTCRLCGAPLRVSFADLGVSPIANDYVEDPGAAETFYPLHAYVCESCLMVQLGTIVDAGHIFRDDYAYFSSYSDSWVDHARRYVEAMVERFGYGSESNVVEVASNDGYLLQFFVQRGVPVLGVDPTAGTAAAAEKRGVTTRVEFFGSELAERLVEEGQAADLVIGNNVLAHVPPVHDFVEGLRVLLKPGGVVTMEFPHLMRLIEKREFDTIYHEHYSYWSVLVVERLFAEHGLELFDVEELPTHGGSLRIYARHAGEGEPGDRVEEIKERERAAGLDRLETYQAFNEAVRGVKRDVLDFLIQAKREGKSIAAYGAAAKGTTLLNYCGVGSEFVDYVLDRNPHKQGTLLPGVRIPIHPPEHALETRPDYLLILVWNLKDEIVEQMAHIREWGGRFVVPVPEVEVLD
ncbi:MAG TPA: class I SAM-dependent methyltransferase [Gaiellaceae bacterium]